MPWHVSASSVLTRSKDIDVDGGFFPHSQLAVGNWGNFYTSANMLILPWYITPRYIQIYCTWCDLHMQEGCSLFSLFKAGFTLPPQMTFL